MIKKCGKLLIVPYEKISGTTFLIKKKEKKEIDKK